VGRPVGERGGGAAAVSYRDDAREGASGADARRATVLAWCTILAALAVPARDQK
jgi:hypothetical protein